MVGVDSVGSRLQAVNMRGRGGERGKEEGREKAMVGIFCIPSTVTLGPEEGFVTPTGLRHWVPDMAVPMSTAYIHSGLHLLRDPLPHKP